MSNISQYLRTFLASLAEVATSGSYNDLANKPTISAVGLSGSYNDLANKPSVLALDSAGGTPCYTGDFKHSLQSANHGRWLICNGQAVSRTVYSALFAIIGTAFGAGDGSTTFLLPNCLGRVNGSIGQGSGLSNRTPGQVVGAETHTLTVAQMPLHNHIDGTASINNNLSFGSSSTTVAGNINVQSSTSTALHAITSSTGGGGSHNNMQPTIFLGNTFIYAGI
jgi:microcystin-dependent protein